MLNCDVKANSEIKLNALVPSSVDPVTASKESFKSSNSEVTCTIDLTSTAVPIPIIAFLRLKKEPLSLSTFLVAEWKY